MSKHNLTLDLKRTSDRNKRTYYVAKIEAPVIIDCSKGVTFLVFTSEQGDEQLQIALMNKKDKQNQSQDSDQEDDSYDNSF